jgi:hypothetical protein
MVQAKWAMLCRQFHLLRAELQRQLLLVQTTRVQCWTTRKWCVGATMSMANLVKET